MSETEKKKKYLVFRKNRSFSYYPGGYSISDADSFTITGYINMLVVLDPETGESQKEHTHVKFMVDGDLLEERLDKAYETLLPWLQDKIDGAIKLARQAITEKRNVQEED